jgi:hypothetical protein
MFHNPRVRPCTFGGSALPKASMITVKATQVRGTLAPAHPLRERWVMSPLAGSTALHSPQFIPRKTGIYINWCWSRLNSFSTDSWTAHGHIRTVPKQAVRRFPGLQVRENGTPNPFLAPPSVTRPSLQILLSFSLTVQAMQHPLPVTGL